MDDSKNLVTFERPMPVEHRVVYGLFGCGALLLAVWMGPVQFEHWGEAPRIDDTGWMILSILLLFGLPLIAAAGLGGAAEIIVDRGARELQEVAWVGPVPAWRQAHPLKDVGVPLVVQSRGGKTPAFKIEIPVKNHVLVPLGYFPTRAEAETVAQAIRDAVSPDGLPPPEHSTAEKMGARLAAIFVRGPRGPLGS